MSLFHVFEFNNIIIFHSSCFLMLSPNIDGYPCGVYICIHSPVPDIKETTQDIGCLPCPFWFFLLPPLSLGLKVFGFSRVHKLIALSSWGWGSTLLCLHCYLNLRLLKLLLFVNVNANSFILLEEFKVYDSLRVKF